MGEDSTPDDRHSQRPGDRGVSEVVGVVLLFGLALAGAALIVLAGSAATDQVADRQRMASAVGSVQEFDAELSSLTREERTNGPSGADIQLAGRSGERVTVRRGDRLTVTVHAADGGVTCSASQGLDALRYETDAGTVVYQAGGVWKRVDGRTTMVQPPAIDYRNGTLDVSIVRLRGDVEGEGQFRARNDLDASRRMTREMNEQLFAREACHNPQKIVVEVTSRNSHAWAQFFEQEFPPSFVSTAGDTVRATVPRSALPAAVKRTENDVVDFTNASRPGTVGDDYLVVDKPGAGTGYNLSARLLGSYSGYDDQKYRTVRKPVYERRPYNVTKRVPVYEYVMYNDTARVPVYTNVSRGGPVEVVFAIDESGSMLLDVREVAAAVNRTLDAMSETHPAAFVGYAGRMDGNAKLRQALTNDHDAVKAATGRMRAGGATPIGDGLGRAVDHLLSEGESGHRRIVILMSDGKQNEGRHPLNGHSAPADRAARNDIRVHTVAFGRAANDRLLEDIAVRTLGTFREANGASSLASAFEEIIENATSGRVVDHYENRTVRKCCKRVLDHYENRTIRKCCKRVKVGYRTERKLVYRRIVQEPVSVFLETSGSTGKYWLVPGDNGTERAVNYVEGGAPTRGLVVGDGERVTVGARVHTCDTTGHRSGNDLYYTGEDRINSSVPGPDRRFNVTRCRRVRNSHSPDAVRTFTDGDGPVAGSPDAPEWWQPGLDGIAGRYLDEGGFALADNQAIAVFHYEDDDRRGDRDFNNVVLLLTVGDAGSAADAGWLVDVEVDRVRIER